MHWFDFMLGSLAVYRLALLVSKESGPMFIFRKLRRLPAPKSSLNEGLHCIWCQSIWFSAAVTAYLWWRGTVDPRDLVLWWLGMSSVAIFCNQMFTRGG